MIADLRAAGALRPTDRAAVLADPGAGRPADPAREIVMIAPPGAWPRAQVESAAAAWAQPGRIIRLAQCRPVHAEALA